MDGARILLIEDCEDIAELIRLLLQAEQYRVKVASSIAEARAFMEAERFDLVLSDLSLPDGDGTCIPAYVRERANGRPAPKAIAMSGYSDAHHVRTSLDAGFAQHLVKPVEEDVLLQIVAAAIGRAY